MINFLNWLDGVLWGIPLIVLMLATGIYFTVRSGFFQFTHFGWIMKNTVGQIFHGTADKNESGKGMLHPSRPLPPPSAARLASATLPAWPPLWLPAARALCSGCGSPLLWA